MKYGNKIIRVLLLIGLLPNMAVAERHSYKVAVDADYAPYEYRDVDGKVKGMLPDMLRAIGKSNGVEFTFSPMNWPQAVKALEQGKVDVLNMIQTPQRMGKYEFSDPHSVITQALFRNKQHAGIDGIEHIAGNVVALQSFDIAIEKLSGQTDFVRALVGSKGEGFLKLNSGKVAAFFTAEQPGLYFIQKNAMENVELATVGLWPQDFSFAAKKGNKEVISLLNKGLSEIKHSGKYGEIVSKWSVRPQNWITRNASQVLVASGILLLATLSLWLWVFLLRSTVRVRTSELLREHKLLQQSEEQYRDLLATMPGALLLIQEGAVVYANQAAMTLFHINEQDMPQPGVDIEPYWFMNIVPARCKELVQTQIDQILQVGQRPFTTEGQLMRGNQEEFDVDIIAVRCSYRGNPAVQLIARDITTRKQAAAQMERLLSIIETSTDFIGMVDAAGTVMYINPAGRRMVGLSEDPATPGMLIDTFLKPGEVARIHSEIFPSILRHGGCQTEVVFLGKNGEKIPCLVAFSVQKNPDDSPASYAIIARDIRQQRKQQEHIEHIQRLESLGVLAGGIAHDFNNILTVILGNAAIAERKAITNPQEMPRYLSNIVESSEKAADLCKQMLAYSGKGKYVVELINLSTMVAQITRLLEVSISKNVVLKYQLAEQLPAVAADTAQMQQIIMNLIINASDAIGNKSGVISIATGVMHADWAYLSDTCVDTDVAEGRYVFLEISDTGNGMDKETQKHIFEPFFTTKHQGHGLGMSAVLGIVRGHQGTLKLYSEPGRGTTFKIMLPISDQLPGISKESSIRIGLWQGTGTVLIVDDEETIRETAAVMLEDRGFTTLAAADGLDAVAIYRQRQEEIVAVLLDMTMPRLDGTGCFRELRRINPQVRVLLCSGYNEQEATSRFVGKGLAGFIQKPYTPDALLEKLQEVLSTTRAERTPSDRV